LWGGLHERSFASARNLFDHCQQDRSSDDDIEAIANLNNEFFYIYFFEE
jgi:hypothetical protein